MTYAKARYYNKEVGRFYAPDPIPFRENDLVSINRYAYAANNPYMFSDPTGEIIWFAVPIIAGAIIGGGTQVAQAPTHEGDIHTLSLKDRAALAITGATAGAAVSVTVAAVGKKEIAQTAFEETTGVELPVPSMAKQLKKISKSELLRDETAKKLKRKHATYVGGEKNGKIVSGCSSNPVGCAEDDIARQLGTDANMTGAKGWRRSKTTGELEYIDIPVCVKCQSKYNKNQFPDDIKFDSGGAWSD